MVTSSNASFTATVVVVTMISAWHDPDNGGQNFLLPAASGQLLQEGMEMGASWAAQDLYYLASPSKFFYFGWLQFPSASLQFFVAVWYGGLDGSVVWVANRNSPAAAKDTLQLTLDGNLVLISASLGRPIWQTNTASKEVSALHILDSGNAVLLSRNGSFSWQSFSFPTDTLLPSQSFLIESTLVSRLPAPSLASGKFKFYIKDAIASIDYIAAATGDLLSSVWKAPNTVRVPFDTINNSAITAQFLMDGIFSMYNLTSGSAYSQIIPSDYGTSEAPNGSGGVFRRLTLDADGDLRMYGWDYVSRSWIVLSESISAFCSSMSLNRVPACGPYGVCVEAPEPACACPPGFHPADTNDVTRGCSSNNLPQSTCQNHQSSVYLVLRNTDFVANDILFKEAISLEDCQSLCTNSCLCAGIIYNNVRVATCWLKSSLLNGYSPQRQPGSRDAYIKLQNSTGFPVINPAAQSPTLSWINSSAYWSQASLQSNSSNYCASPVVANNSLNQSPDCQKYITKRALHVIITLVSLIELLCFLVGLLFLWKRNTCRHGRKPSLTQHAVCRAFTYAELVEATDRFRYPLGSGAFGVVFRGVLPEGSEIAVKKLQTNVLQIADAQFRAEIATLGRIHHMNLLRLYGFCAEGPDQRLLVYEFMLNGSLNRVLFEEGGEGTDCSVAATEGSNSLRRSSLDWKTRYNICLGTARGLAYLHEECLDCIVHCDIKPENILLDREFCPRVADFGLAYLFGRNETLQVSHVRGTRGYLAPEWVTYMPVTAKADVFSYGMVLIEIVTGRRNFRFTPSAIDAGKWNHPRWAFRQVKSGCLEKVVDQAIFGEVLADDVVYREVERVLSIAFLCLHREANARPNMRNIVQMLECSIPLPALPGGPGSFQEQAADVTFNADQFSLGPLYRDSSSVVEGSTTTTLSAR